MEASEIRRAVEAGRATASALGLQADDLVVIHNSDRIALRLIPCDVLARVAPSALQAGSEFEVEVARRLAETGGPVAELEPRVEHRATTTSCPMGTTGEWRGSTRSGPRSIATDRTGHNRCQAGDGVYRLGPWSFRGPGGLPFQAASGLRNARSRKNGVVTHS